MLKSAYLILFNGASCFMWSYTLALSVMHYANDGGVDGYFAKVWAALFWAQSLAIMELVHIVLGLVRSNFSTAFLQVFSRLFFVWGLLIYVPDTHSSWGVSLMAISWSLVEVPRYLYYALNEVGAVPSVLKWLRYSLFMVLYPSGITGELVTIWSGMEQIKRDRPLSMYMPNKYNFEFDFYYFVWLMLLIYVPGSPTMFGHMSAQRKKVLGNAQDEKKKKSA